MSLQIDYKLLIPFDLTWKSDEVGKIFITPSPLKHTHIHYDLSFHQSQQKIFRITHPNFAITTVIVLGICNKQRSQQTKAKKRYDKKSYKNPGQALVGSI